MFWRGSDLEFEGARSVRWDCDDSFCPSTIGIAVVVGSKVTRLTGSVRWDCERRVSRSHRLSLQAGALEVTRSVRWDCDFSNCEIWKAASGGMVGRDQIS